MKKLHLSFTPEMLSQCAKSVLGVTGTTALLLLIGRDTLGEAVIALLYLVPIGWIASRWGQGPGLSAALTAALMFDFFFIPPFFTFTVGSLEGWLVLIIFTLVAALIVSRFQSVLAQARASERNAIFMYELSAALAGLNTQQTVAATVAEHLQRILQAQLVQVLVEPASPARAFISSAPSGAAASGKPQRVIPLQATRSLIGEISLWRDQAALPPRDDHLLDNLARQAALALERAGQVEADNRVLPVTSVAARAQG